MKQWKIIILPLLVLLLCISPVMGGTISNPGFETGDTSSWNTVIKPDGSISVVSSTLGWTASEGTYFAILNSGTTVASNYTVLKQTVNLDVGQTIGFDYFFTSGLEAATLNSTSCGEILGKVRLVLSSATGTTVLSLNTNSDQSTPGVWTTEYSDPVAQAGDYIIKFKIKNQSAPNDWAVFGIDNVRTTEGCDNGEPSGAIPEPLTMLGSFMGLACLGGYIRKRKS